MKLMLSIKKKYCELPAPAKASYWFLICGFIQKGLTLLTTPIFTRLMASSEYGVFNVYSSWGSILTIIVSLNLASGVYTRGLVKYEQDRHAFSCSLYSLATIVFFVWLILLYIFRDAFEIVLKLPTHYIVLLFADIYVCAVFHFWSAEQRVEYKYKKLVVVTLINSFLQTIAGVIIVSNTDDKVFGRIISIVGSDVILFITFAFIPFLNRPIHIRFSYWKYALKFNLPLVPHYLSQVVLNQSDRIMIQRYDSDSAAGLYGLSYSLASVLSIINTSIINTLTPWMYKKIKEKEYQSIRKYSILILSLVASLNLMLILIAPEVIKVFAPSEYYEAVYVIPPVSASVFFIFLYSWFSIFEFYFEKTHLMMIASLFGAITNIVLNYIFIKKYGYLAAGYTTLFCYILYVIGHYCFMRRLCIKYLDGIKIYNMKIIILISLLFLFAGALFMSLYNLTIIRYSIIGCCLIGIIIRRKQLSRFFVKLKKSLG